MIVYGTFFQSSISLEYENEETPIKNLIYRREEGDNNEFIITTEISPKQYGKLYELLNKLGYPSADPLSDINNSLT